MIVMSEHNLCSDCYKPYEELNWCKECRAKQFQQNFSNWTSGNEFIDRFIQDTQLNAQNHKQVLEWIPYDKFKNIEYLDKGGFSIIYKAIWLEGPWSHDEESWMNQNNHTVVLKSLNNSSNLNEEFLNEVLYY